MRRDILLLIRGVLGVAVVLLLLVGGQMALDLAGGYPFGRLAVFDLAAARHLNNVLNRNLNQLLAVTFTTVAIAVPLTANLYSLKFLEFFIKDPVNTAVLVLVVFINLNNTSAAYALKDDFVPGLQLHVSLVLVMVYYTLLFPYLYYIFRFLHPNTLIVRLEEEITSELQAAARRPARAAALRRAAAEGIEHLANIAIRSVDRGDRNTAIESIFSLERVARAYWALKAQLPAAWFVAEPHFFLGFSSSAVEEFTHSGSWVEIKVFSQLRLIASAAIPRAHDVIDTTAKTLRKLGLEQAARQDQALREVVMEYFNTFIRLALTRRDPRSVFTLFDHYRIFAETLNPDFPEFGLEIAYYFQYYGQVARDLQMPFLVELIAHDLGTLVKYAWQKQTPNRQRLLERFLGYDEAARPPLPGVKKAQALLASYFSLAGQPEPLALIRRHFEGLGPELVGRIREDLLHIRREKYWEVNERRMNVDYVPEAQREKLREFLDGVLAAARA